MARTPKALVKPDMLRWARESIGLSREKAGKSAGVSADRVRDWEASDNDAAPSIAQLRQLANAYKRPLAVFFLSEPPRDFDALRDFRRLPAVISAADAISPTLNGEIRRAHEQREIFLELAEDVDDEVPAFARAPLPRDPEDAGAVVRDVLGVPLEQQFKWSEKYETLNGWIQAAEEAGALVLQVSRVDMDEARGFSISEAVLPVLALNGGDSPRGKVFTLLHEVAHLLINISGICDLHESPASSDDIEVYCNAVAAAALMPRHTFAREELVQAGLRDEAWSDSLLDVLARKYSVSQESVLRRLVTIGLVSRDFYAERHLVYLEIYRRARAETKGQDVRIPRHVMRLRDLGKPYVRTVLEAYHQRSINTADVSDLLGLKVNHLPKIEQALTR